jgi:hypothetical protein
MSFNAREAAQKLFDLADVIEKQAAQKTFFVCASCNHTANLESINSTRTKYASDNGIDDVTSISVGDTIACSACSGDMKYASTEESEKFFVEASTKESADDDLELDGLESDDTTEDDTLEDEATDDSTEDPDIDAEGDGDIDVDDSENESEGESEDDDLGSEDEDKAEKKPKKRTTKDKKKSDGKVEMKEAPEAQFGDDDKKSKTAFDNAVSRYSL